MSDTHAKKLEDLTHEERAAEVETMRVLLTGALYGSLMQFTANIMQGAHLSDPGSSDNRPDYVDVILQDGWRVRFTTSILPPEES